MNHSLTESFGTAGARYADGNSEGVDGSATSLMSATSNTNSNANTDVVGIDLSGAVTTRLAGRDVLFNRSPLSSGQSTTSSSSSSSTSRECTPEALVGPAEMDPSLHHLPHTSPIAGDLPTSEVLPNVTSPSLGFDLPPHKNEDPSLPHSPDTPTSAQYNVRHEMQSLPLSSNIASPTDLSSPPPGLNIMLDSHSPLSNVIFSQNLLTPITSATGQLQDDDDELQVCLWNNCGQEFSSLRSLVSHLDRGHTLAMSQYVCQWKDCSRGQKPFDARYKLITHLRCHTGEKPYKCEISGCSRCFSRLENLKLHVRTHTGEKPYVCHFEGCNKRFNNTSDRAKHMKTHITRKPYACKFPGCGKSYTDPSSMRKHVKFAHKMREGPSGEPVVGCNLSPQRSSRKYSTASTSSSSSSAPSTPTSILLPKVHGGAITVSPVGGTFFPASPRVAQTVYVQSPQSLPSANPTLVASSNNASRSSPSLISVPTVIQVAGQTFNTPVNIIQPGAAAAAQPVPQPILMQPATASQQPVLMMLPNATSVTTNGQQLGLQSPQKVAHVLQGVPQVVVTQQSQDQIPRASALLAAQQQSSPQPQAMVQVQVNGKDSDSSAIENQLRLQIAHLQRQLAESSRSTGTAACAAQQTKSLQQNESIVAVQSRLNQLPVSTATGGVVAIATTAATRTTQLPQGGFVSLIQPQGQAVTHAQLPTAIQPQQLNSVIPTQMTPCAQPSAAFQLSNLTTPVAQNLTQNSLGFPTKNLTFVNPAATTVWGLTPGRSGAYIIPQVMVPGTQVLQSQGVTPQIIQLAPQHQGNGKI